MNYNSCPKPSGPRVDSGANFQCHRSCGSPGKLKPEQPQLRHRQHGLHNYPMDAVPLYASYVFDDRDPIILAREELHWSLA